MTSIWHAADESRSGATTTRNGDATQLTVTGLTKSFSGKSAVEDVGFSGEPGEFITLLGPSGCGKTTTLRCVAGIETPSSGQVIIGGRMVFCDKLRINEAPEARDVGMVFQSYALWPHMTVRDNVAYPLRSRKVPRREAWRRSEEMLERVGLRDLVGRTPAQLSGGQQQRVALARALVYRPQLLLLDEPLSNLDAQLRETMRSDIKRIQRDSGVTTLYVTHDRTEAMTLSDRLIVLSDGRIVEQGAPMELLQRPQTAFVASLLGSCNILHATVTECSKLGDGYIVTAALGVGGTTVAVQGMSRKPMAGGAGAAICARPTDVEIIRAGAIDHWSNDVARLPVDGVVTSVSMTGLSFEYTISLGEYSVMAITTHAAGIGVGCRVAIGLSVPLTTVVPAQS